MVGFKDNNIYSGITKIIIQLNYRVREKDLEDMEKSISEKLGAKVVILNGSMEIVAIETGLNNG